MFYMRYVKRFFESIDNNEEIVKFIEDILIELNQEGFTTEAFSLKTIKKYGIGNYDLCVDISKSRFLYKEIKDVILTMESYLRSNGYNFYYMNIERNVPNHPNSIWTSYDIIEDYSDVNGVGIPMVSISLLFTNYLT